jgi:hypothetical protein
MQFAFTEEQELLRREARQVLGNGGWGREELDDLGFLDRAVLFEEAGRANRGEEFFDSEAPENEQLAALALEAAGIARRALELGVEHAKTREQFGRPIGVYQAVAHPLADTYVETGASASPGSTCSIGITSGRSGSRLTVAIRASCARGSRPGCSTDAHGARHRGVIRHRCSVRCPSRGCGLARPRGRAALG